MANPDRPSGFRLVKTLTGAPIASVMRSVGVTGGADMFVGDLITLTANLAVVGATNDTAFLGVAVGFGKRDAASGEFAGAYNPDVLTTIHYDDGASVAADWRVFYVPVDEAIFEVQGNIANLAVGDTADLDVSTGGNTVSGRSGQEITTGANGDVKVVEIPSFPDNDSSLVNGRYNVAVSKANTAWA